MIVPVLTTLDVPAPWMFTAVSLAVVPVAVIVSLFWKVVTPPRNRTPRSDPCMASLLVKLVTAPTNTPAPPSVLVIVPLLRNVPVVPCTRTVSSAPVEIVPLLVNVPVMFPWM